MKALKAAGYTVGAIILLPLITISLLLIYWEVRTPPAFETDPILTLETWTAVPPGSTITTQHNSNTDLVFYKGFFYLIHARTKWHLIDKKGSLVLHRSADCRTWEEITRIHVPDVDVRDPKFAVIRGKLFLYFLLNLRFDPLPHTTYWTVSDDGMHWQQPQEMDTVTVLHKEGGRTVRVTRGGISFWRAKSRDNKTWYMLAFGIKPQYGKSVTFLIRSTDGIHWQEVADVYTEHETAEPEHEFLPDGSMIATLRCEHMGTPGSQFGNPTANTIIAQASPPYTRWSCAHSFITRLDGETLFAIGDRVFAVGRNHLGPRKDMGTVLGRKRTSFYEVKSDRLVHLFDLPSNGDTAYTGVVRRGDDIYVSYYTSPIHKDYPWLLGVCFFPKTEIRIAKLSAEGLLKYADSKSGEKE